MYGSLDVSTSGLLAQKTRLNVISMNLANANALVNVETGEYEPYRRRMVVFEAVGEPQAAQGVRVKEILIDRSDLTLKHEPGNPYADADGYVAYPNVDQTIEQVNAMEALRSYEANIAVMEATKSMMSVALEALG